MAEPPSPLRQDLARGLTRALVLCPVLMSLMLVLGLIIPSRPSLRTMLPLVVSAAVFGLFPLPLAMIEYRAQRERWGVARTVLLVWGCAAGLSALAALQGRYLEAILQSGDPARGLADVGLSLRALWNRPVEIGLALAALAAPYAGAAFVHQRGDLLNRRLVLALGLTLVPCSCSLGYAGIAFLAVALMTVVVSLCYGLAHLLHPRLWRFGYREEVAYLRKLAADGQLHAGRIYLLALVDHEPARQLRGLDAPELEPDLLRWVGRLEKGGSQALLRAANAARGLVDEPEIDPAAPIPQGLQRLAIDSAREAERAHGEQEVRRAIREAIVAYALEPKGPSASA